jgi:metal-responsive CopG/Arc/MetJ family transcriptional regulator
MSGNMTKLQFYINSELDEKLEELAHQLKMSKSEIIRQSIRDFLKMKETDIEDPLLGIVGLGRSGLHDVAENHDKYLTERKTE